MINPKILKSIGVVLDAIRPLFFAILGGFVAGSVQQCNDRQPVNLVVTNQQYESQIHALQKQQDSLARNLPDIDAAMRYLAERYGAGGDREKDRSGSANLRGGDPRARPDKAIQQPANSTTQR